MSSFFMGIVLSVIDKRYLLIVLEVFTVLSPWLLFLSILVLFKSLYKQAKLRKKSAIALVAFSHFLLPDPQVEQKIKTVVEQKQSVKKRQDKSKLK